MIFSVFFFQLEQIEFNTNKASDYVTDSVAAAFFIERTGLPVDNSTSDVITESGSGGAESSATVQVQVSPIVVGTGVDLYCFQNSPYDCEGFFGQAKLTLTGALRCATCEGDAFTGIGTPGSAPTPAPVTFDDDDGLSKVGQERAQGGTPAPTPVGFGENSGSVGAELGEKEEEATLFGTTGNMRWVVVGLLGALGTAVLLCLCLTVVCRGGGKRKRKGSARRRSNSNNGEVEEGIHAARVGPPSASRSRANANHQVHGEQESLEKTPRSGFNQFFAVSPGTTSAKRSSVAGAIASTVEVGSPLAARKAREVARQRVMRMSEEADARAEANYFEGDGGWSESGPGLAQRPTSPTCSIASLGSRKGFAALPGTEREHGVSGSTRTGRSTNRSTSVSRDSSTSRSASRRGSGITNPSNSRRGSYRDDAGVSRSPSNTRRDSGKDEWIFKSKPADRSRSTTPELRRDRPMPVKSIASGAVLPDVSTIPVPGPSRESSGQPFPGAASMLPTAWAADTLVSSEDMPITTRRPEVRGGERERGRSPRKSTSRGRAEPSEEDGVWAPDLYRVDGVSGQGSTQPSRRGSHTESAMQNTARVTSRENSRRGSSTERTKRGPSAERTRRGSNTSARNEARSGSRNVGRSGTSRSGAQTGSRSVSSHSASQSRANSPDRSESNDASMWPADVEMGVS